MATKVPGVESDFTPDFKMISARKVVSSMKANITGVLASEIRRLLDVARKQNLIGEVFVENSVTKTDKLQKELQKEKQESAKIFLELKQILERATSAQKKQDNENGGSDETGQPSELQTGVRRGRNLDLRRCPGRANQFTVWTRDRPDKSDSWHLFWRNCLEKTQWQVLS